jgi:hypothetical protein
MPRPKRRPGLILIAGWREWVGLPALGVEAIKAKLDTGAKTSALHAFEIERFTRERMDWVRFTLHPHQRSVRETIVSEARLVDERWVRSSTGGRTFRPVIETDLLIDGRRWPIEVTLVRRDMMGFRLLLGRQALRRRILVDSSASFLAGRTPANPSASLSETSS